MATNPIDLTTVAAVKALLGITSSDSDALFQTLITACSQMVCNYCGRSSFLTQAFTEIYDGTGRDWMLLRQWPVQSITSISYDATVITSQASGTPPNNGYILENPLPSGGEQRVMVYGYWFPRGRSNITVAYQAGYSAVPFDAAQACAEIVGEAFNRRKRLGENSKTLAGQEVISFSTANLSAPVKLMLDTYRRKTPVW